MMELCRFQFHLLSVFTACVIFVHFNSLIEAALFISDKTQAVEYLQVYGYISESNSENPINPETLQTALKEFQRFFGLQETGKLDDQTYAQMNHRRCGMKDILDNGSDRSKGYVIQGTKWRNTDLTYRISKYSNLFKSKQDTEKEIAKAFKVWSDATNLNFARMDKGHVVIDIRFEDKKHCDELPFDGPNGNPTKARAFSPEDGGDIRFYEDYWTADKDYGTSIYQMAVHLIGHSLGLSHSDVRSSVMYPFYDGYKPTFSLDKVDIEGIQSLYGGARKKGSDLVPFEPTPDYIAVNAVADLCQDASMDTAVTTQDGRTYIFKGDNYWEVNNDGLVHRDPRSISQDWGGLPGDLDAALTWANGDTYFFKKNEYWKTRNKQMQWGYPLSISQHWGLPNDLDAAFVWGENGKSYFFKGSQFWGYDQNTKQPIANFYPRPISEWKDIPDNIDAVLPWAFDKTYFFKGKYNYRYNNKKQEVDKDDPPLFPRPTAVWWFGCKQ